MNKWRQKLCCFGVYTLEIIKIFLYILQLIQALIKPPDDENVYKTQQQKKSHPYYKKSGRGHNNDYCYACEEGGALICCDKCPVSFHLGCQ